LALEVPGVVCLPASYGRGQLGSDLELTLAAMAGLAAHPNVSGALIVSFEPESARRISVWVEALGREVETLSLLTVGGLTAAMKAGREILGRLLLSAQTEKREPFSIKDLLIGLECGGSDTSSGVIANPALGMISDRLIGFRAATIFSEPLECIGCENALAARAVDQQVAARILASVEKYKKIARDQGVDLAGVNPTADNIAGGLSTIEEKSLGAVAKSGTGPIAGVLAYGERPPGKGLWFMDAPAAAVENLTALAAAGCQAVFFSTGSVNPVGHPIAPTLKVCANPEAVYRMAEHVDVDLSGGLDGTLRLEACRDLLEDRLIKVVNGDSVAAERLGYLETNISRFGQSV
jgi:altronate dehydratase large subunit